MKRRAYSDCDMARVDKLAVEFVCNGTRMRLNTDERVHAVRLMTGRVAASEMAYRMGIYEREVTRIMHALGAQHCPLCKCLCWIDTDGIVAEHRDFRHGCHGELCAMSGQDRYDTRAAHLRRANTVVLAS